MQLVTNMKGLLGGTASASVAVRNSIWFSGSRLTALLVNIVVVIFISRHLGPAGFGVLSYLIAVAAILGTIGNLGLNAILTRELIRRPDEQDIILGTGLSLRFLGGILVAVVGMSIVHWLRPDDSELAWFVGLLLLGETTKAGLVYSFWFESEARAAPIGFGRVLIAMAGAAIKIVLVLVDASLQAFVIAQAIDGVLVLVVFGSLYGYHCRSPIRVRISMCEARSLLSSSLPLAISGVTAVIYLKVDQVMLGQMVGDDAVGVYAIASRLSEAWYFVPTAIATSVFPFLLRLRKNNFLQYQKRLQDLFDALTWLGIIAAIGISLIGPLAIPIMFGKEYQGAGVLLAVHVWGGVFMAPRALASKWLLGEDMIRYSVLSQAGGAILNISLNIALIPIYGSLGAALATVISYATSGYLLFFVAPETRPIAVMITRSVLAPLRFRFR